MRLKLLLILLLSLTATLTLADDTKFQATARSKVRVGEQFILTYSLNAEGQAFKGPSLANNFRVLTGPNRSHSSNFQYINGQMNQSISTKFTYYLAAKKEGTYTISPATVTVDGKDYTSNALKIEVVKGASTPSGGNQNQGNRQNPNQSTTTPATGTISEDDVFLRATADKTTAFQGEQILVNFTIYTRVPIAQLAVEKDPSMGGFWAKDLMDNNTQLKQRTEIINGVEYIVADLKKVALFPQKNGELSIDPMELSCVAQVRNSNARRRTGDAFFDNFFNDPFFDRYQNIPLTLKSKPIRINVKPLPNEGRPSDFSGAVGKFSFAPTIDKTELEAHNDINLTFKISGQGNIDLVNLPAVTFPPDFDVFDPKVSTRSNTNSRGVSGSKTIEYLVIPRNAGDFTINPISFTYFDVAQSKYVTLSSPEYTIRVSKGDLPAGNIAYSGVVKEDIKYIGSDIRYIKTGSLNLLPLNVYFFGSQLFNILIIVPLILTIVLIIIIRRNQKKRQDIALMKHKKATKLARKNLKKAQQYLGTQGLESFYNEISTALYGYLSDKFAIQRSDLSMDNVSEILTEKSISDTIIKDFMSILNECEFVRFAPSKEEFNMESTYHNAIKVISEIESSLK